MYRDKETGLIALTHSDIRLARPNASLPSDLTNEIIQEVGFDMVRQAPRPNVDEIRQAVSEADPVWSDGEWVQAWRVTDLPVEQATQNLALALTSKRLQINAWRLQANRGTFTHGGKSFACDELSRSDIDGITSYVTLCGALPPDWPGGWKAIDNTYLAITTVDQWRQFVASMVASGSANFERSQVLKAQLELCTTQAQIDAIQW